MLQLKERSHRKVFGLIRSQGEVSGAMLARQTDMQPSSLVYILRHLKEKELIRVSGYGTSTVKGGKKPVLWEVNPDYGVVIGLEVMNRAIRGVLVNLSGDVLLRVEKEFNPGKPEKTVSRIKATLSEIITESPYPREKLLYISLAVSGIVNPFDYRIMYSYGLKMEEYDLASIIAEEFRVPTGIINDANAGALEEQWFHFKKEPVSNILYIDYNSASGGLGAGVIINGKLFTGTNGLAGEVFSKIPSLERIVKREHSQVQAESSLLDARGKGLSKIQLTELVHFSSNGCLASKSSLTQVSSLISSEISKIIVFYDPGLIILGGDLSNCEKSCCDEIENALAEFFRQSYPHKIKTPAIRFAQSKIFSVAIGGTALYLLDELSL